MNVLYVCADRGIPVLGNKGASVHVRSLVSAMTGAGHRVTLAARSWGSGNVPPRAHLLEHLEEDVQRSTLQLQELIAAQRPDVAIERYSLQSGAARIASAGTGIPLTLEVNAPLVAEATRYRGLADPRAQAREHEILRGADRINVVSSVLLHYVRAVAPRVPSEWIPNGADVERFRRAPVARLVGAGPDRVAVGFSGSMKPWHGVEQLLEAFARARGEHARAVLVLVGAGPEEARVRTRAAELGVAGSVVHVGQVPHTAVAPLVARFDVAVAPYLPIECFYFHPLKVLEYLAAGKAVVYADQGDLRALVGSGGLGYTPGSVTELADRLSQLLGDAELRADLAVAAEARGEELDWAVVAERVLRFASGSAGNEPASRAAVAV
jgi:glycosyltransferase involved in cell wall biosynthesis